MKIPIIGDWGGKCGKAQKKVMKSISKSDVNNVISVGDTIYMSEENEEHSQSCNFEDCKKLIYHIIMENMKCTKLLQGKYWIMAFGNHDEEYPKVTANSKLSCLSLMESRCVTSSNVSDLMETAIRAIKSPLNTFFRSQFELFKTVSYMESLLIFL